MRASFFLAAQLVIACGSSEPPPSAPPARRAEAAASRAAGTRPAAARDAPPASAEPDSHGIGTACPAPHEEAGRAERTFVCDASGRVAGVWAPVDVLEGIPPEGAEILRDEPMHGERGVALHVAALGTKIYVVHVTCGRCRRVLGMAFAGDLERLGEDDLRRVQAEAGLASDPLLRTVDAWRAAFANRPVPAAGDER